MGRSVGRQQEQRQGQGTLGSTKGVRSSSGGKATPPLILRRRPRMSCWKRFRCSVRTSGALHHRTPMLN